ncbi:hypothetical protein PY649_34210, partial [Rhizobium mayense]|nr:hypothetical protein [Rhizobium mayense]
WLRTATRRYRRKYSNPKPLERTQNWIKLGGKVTSSVIGLGDAVLPRDRGGYWRRHNQPPEPRMPQK